MGLVDYGVNGGSTYFYSASELKSWVNFTTLSIGTATKGAPAHHMDVQQNSVAVDIYESVSTTGQYWIQDVPQIAQSGSTYSVTAEDNIWNFSSPTASMTGPVFGNLENDCKSGGVESDGFYFCYAAQTFTTKLPFEIEMITVTGLDTSFPGHFDASAVLFEFGVYHAGKLVGFEAFDWVDFDINNAPNTPFFDVNGAAPNNFGTFLDYETLVCGPNGGSNIQFNNIKATFSAYYVSATTGTFNTIPHAWSAGSNTAETASGVHMKKGSGDTGVASKGADNNVQLF
jgi:hypothetical protein